MLHDLYDQLIDFAREKQRGRRRAGVHKSVPYPIVILVVGDKQRDLLDGLYAQLTARWSGCLGALQFCYCYIDAPYEGSSPIYQTKLDLCGLEKQGAGAIGDLPETLKAVNEVMGEVVRRISSDGQVAMQQADIHIITAPEDETEPLLSDLSAIAASRWEDFGAVRVNCRLYLLLPGEYRTDAERTRVSSMMDQLQAADAGEYRQEVQQPHAGVPPRVCTIQRLFNAVMLLDEMDETGRFYNSHGERLGLLVDLIENGWSGGSFLQTAGVQEGTAGPEYWLAQAVNTLCGKVLAQTGSSGNKIEPKLAIDAIAAATKERMQGMERALSPCCLFFRGRINRVSGMPVDEGEQAVFGHALDTAYVSWREGLPPLQVPEEVEQLLDTTDSEEETRRLADRLWGWAKECRDKAVPPPDQSCQGFHISGTEAEKVLRFRNFLKQVKYMPQRIMDEQLCCASLAELCAERCRGRIEAIRNEQAEFAEFAQAVDQVWNILRNKYNGGIAMEADWMKEPPELARLRKSGAQAVRDGKASPVLSLVAECVELNSPPRFAACQPDLLLFCRIPITMGITTQIWRIDQGISAGRVLKLAMICDRYEEEAAQRVFMLQKARQPS